MCFPRGCVSLRGSVLTPSRLRSFDRPRSKVAPFRLRWARWRSSDLHPSFVSWWDSEHCPARSRWLAGTGRLGDIELGYDALVGVDLRDVVQASTDQLSS